MADQAQSVADYMAAWNETDAGKRRALLERCWAAGGVYEDPTGHVAGRDALDVHIAQFHRTMPGCRIAFASGCQVHHDKVHFTWKMTGPGGATMNGGRDFGVLDADGRIRSITGFFGEPPVA